MTLAPGRAETSHGGPPQSPQGRAGFNLPIPLVCSFPQFDHREVLDLRVADRPRSPKDQARLRVLTERSELNRSGERRWADANDGGSAAGYRIEPRRSAPIHFAADLHIVASNAA